MDVTEVPGRIATSDKELVASVYELLGRTTGSSNFVSTLRVVDTLTSRYIFQIGNPRDLDMTTMRNLSLKMSTARSVKFDLPRRAIVVECWRESHSDRKENNKKRKREDVEELETIETLPDYIEEKLGAVSPSLAGEVPVLRSIMLWVLNRPEDFTEFAFDLTRNEADEVFDMHLRDFDAFSLKFVKNLMGQFKTFVKDLIVDWSSQMLVLRVSR